MEYKIDCTNIDSLPLKRLNLVVGPKAEPAGSCISKCTGIVRRPYTRRNFPYSYAYRPPMSHSIRSSFSEKEVVHHLCLTDSDSQIMERLFDLERHIDRKRRITHTRYLRFMYLQTWLFCDLTGKPGFERLTSKMYHVAEVDDPEGDQSEDDGPKDDIPEDDSSKDDNLDDDNSQNEDSENSESETLSSKPRDYSTETETDEDDTDEDQADDDRSNGFYPVISWAPSFEGSYHVEDEDSGRDDEKVWDRCYALERELERPVEDTADMLNRYTYKR